MKLLAINPGSSTLKFGIFDRDADAAIVRGVVPLSSSCCLGEVVQELVEQHPEVEAIGARVVHGGDEFNEAKVVSDSLLAGIQRMSSLAPLHNPRDLEVIRSAMAVDSRRPIVAVFDTSFHSTMSSLAASYALPADLTDELHVRRYGFHGISYRYIVGQMARATGSSRGRMIACHLGSGASVCAIRDGVSVETSMGMTPTEGLIMGTRSGDVDPGAILYILRQTGMSIDDADNLLNRKSGLLALSKRSADIRTLEAAAAKGDANAEFALESFAYRVAKYIGAYSVVLNGFDQLVFAGGIGENAPAMRQRIAGRLGSLGITTSLGLPGAEAATQISNDIQPSVWVVRTDEERQIANESFAALGS